MNIAEPDFSGVSANRYKILNVPKQGVELENRVVGAKANWSITNTRPLNQRRFQRSGANLMELFRAYGVRAKSRKTSLVLHLSLGLFRNFYKRV